MQEIREDSIDYNLLKFIDPPSTYPCTSLDISSQIQTKFYEQCLRFLKQQKKLYQCSKKIQNRLSSSILDAASLDQHIRQKSQKLQKITRQLRKINHHQSQQQKKQQFLSAICKFINMEQARKIMLQTKIINQGQFIEQLQEIDHLSLEVANLNSDIKLIQQIKQQLSSLLLQTVDKLIKGSLSQSLVQKITSDYAEPFLRDPKISNIFITNLTNHRLNYFRLGLNPLINNLNYVQNISQLFQKIIEQWLKLLQNQIKIFNKENNRKQIKNILKQVMSRLLVQILPKMQRGIYKLKNIVQMSKIRASLVELKNMLDLCGEAAWDPLPKLMLKLYIIIQEKLEETAEQLQIAKYNIYSLVSYVPIRQHLQIIKQAKSYDPTNKQLNWQRGFKRLADSRDPSKQPNNKSLIIFNLNIWYLYQNVMKDQGQLKQRAQTLIKQGITTIVNLNLLPLKKQPQSKQLQKLLDICSDTTTVKKNLYSQINLLGHEKLRTMVQKQIINRFIQQIYLVILKQYNLENGLKNEEVVELCKKQKLNLNKYGKVSESLRIFNQEQIRGLLM